MTGEARAYDAQAERHRDDAAVLRYYAEELEDIKQILRQGVRRRLMKEEAIATKLEVLDEMAVEFILLAEEHDESQAMHVRFARMARRAAKEAAAAR